MKAISLYLVVVFALAACAQNAEVRGKLQFEESGGARVEKTKSRERQAVVWLTPLDQQPEGGSGSPRTAQLVQKDKAFHPHVVVIPAGSSVEFPNRDPFFHNVFSLFEGKRFDLGMYEAGSSRTVRFERPGISYIFCNIHPEMSAVVISLRTPYFAWADAAGNFSLKDIPPGRYQFALWADGASPDSLEALSRVVTVAGEQASIGNVSVQITSLAHKNKYGRDYDPAAKAPYEHP